MSSIMGAMRPEGPELFALKKKENLHSTLFTL